MTVDHAEAQSTQDLSHHVQPYFNLYIPTTYFFVQIPCPHTECPVPSVNLSPSRPSPTTRNYIHAPNTRNYIAVADYMQLHATTSPTPVYISQLTLPDQASCR